MQKSLKTLITIFLCFFLEGNFILVNAQPLSAQELKKKLLQKDFLGPVKKGKNKRLQNSSKSVKAKLEKLLKSNKTYKKKNQKNRKKKIYSRDKKLSFLKKIEALKNQKSKTIQDKKTPKKVDKKNKKIELLKKIQSQKSPKSVHLEKVKPNKNIEPAPKIIIEKPKLEPKKEVPIYQEKTNASTNKNLLYDVFHKPLSSDYRATDLVPFSNFGIKTTKGNGVEENLSREIIMTPLKNLIDFCEKTANRSIFIRSGFRSYATQKTTYAKYGSAYAAYPGTSEHQLGVAVDVEVHNYKSKEFMNTANPVYQCFTKNAHDYGFIQSFFRNNPYGYQEEPWHWRYVGKQAATKLIFQIGKYQPEKLFVSL